MKFINKWDLLTSKSCKVESDFSRSGSEIVCFKACSAATWISDSLIGRSSVGEELSKFTGPEKFLDIELGLVLLEGGNFETPSAPELPIYQIFKSNKISERGKKSIFIFITHQQHCDDYQTTLKHFQ